MAGPIGNMSPTGGIAPTRPLQGMPTPVPAPPPEPGSAPLGRDTAQLSAGGIPATGEVPDLRAQVGPVSLDDLLGADLAPVRTAADARREAEEGWHEFEPGSVYDFQRIERDAFNVNEPLDSGWALEQLGRNQGLEEAALGKLSKEQQAQYQDIAKHTEQDPQARLALQVMLVEGKLTGGPKATGGHDLLETLHAVASKPMVKPLDPDTVLSDLIQEVALPSAIAQGPNGTCTATSVQIKLARENPAEYARLVGGLASPEGKVTLANGDEVQRDPGSEKASPRAQKYRMPSGEIVTRPTQDSRTDASRLFQSAFMQYGVGAGNDYDPVKDTMQDPRFQGPTLTGKALAGISNASVETLLAPTFAGMVDDDAKSLETADAVVKRIADETQRGNSVTVGLAWGEADKDGKIHGNHVIDVTRVENGRAYYDNPWGKEESMSLEELTKRVKYAQIATQPSK